MTQASPTVSAILPNYNHGKQIAVAIDALLNQTVPITELVVVDDGSTDGSVAVISALAQIDNRIRLLRHATNKGAIAALNTGLAASQGDYIYMAAADDRALPHLVETLSAELARSPEAAFAAGEVFLVSPNSRTGVRPIVRPSETAQFFDPAATARLLSRMDNVILTGAALIRRNAIIEAGGLREDLSSFADGFLLRQLAFKQGFVFVPQPLAEWHVSPDGLSRSSATNLGLTLDLQDAAAKAMAASDDFPSAYWPSLRRRWRFSALRLAIEAGTAQGAAAEELMPGPAALRGPMVQLAQRGAAGRALSLAWASLWYRPYPAMLLARTAVSRVLGRSRDKGERAYPGR